MSGRLIAGVDENGVVVPLKVNNQGRLEISGIDGGSSGGNTGDASAANQQTQIDRLEEIAGQTTSFDGVDTFFSVGYSALQLLINLGTKFESAASTDTGQGSVIAILKRLLSVKLLIKTQTPSFTSVTTSGTIAAGATSVSIANVGSFDGTVLGTNLPAGASIEFNANWIHILGSVNYDATGTTFLIQEVR
jgi:hypothetical protein